MPIMRKKVNKVLNAREKALQKQPIKNIKGSTRQMMNPDAVAEYFKVQKKVDKAQKSRKSGVKGLVRKAVAGKKVNARRKNIEKIGKRTSYTGVAKKLLGNIKPGEQIKIISKRGNKREVTLLGASKNGEAIIVLQGKEHIALHASRIEKVSLV